MTWDDLLRALSRGPRAASALKRELRLSRSVLQRALARERRRLVVTGRARATRYAARRAIDGLHTPVPVYEVDRTGGIRHALTLHPVEPCGSWCEPHVADVPSGFFETDPAAAGPDPFADVPWFLVDAKPGGFLGRAWVRAHTDRGTPADPARWSGDDVLRFASLYGVDLPGAFVIGDFARDLVTRGIDPGAEAVVAGTEAAAYADLAQRALVEPPWGSSPGGEQPKFAVTVRDRDVRRCIVKFSPPMDSPGGRRWADLLTAEHLAHVVLLEHGVDAARSRLVDGGGRRFLEVERFDRHGERGRSGLVSLRALDPWGIAGELRRWTLATARLVDEGLVAPADHARVDWLEAFGLLIANTDMHPANLSFRMRGTTLAGLAPTYDMVPMFHAPRHGGELPAGQFVPSIEREDLPPSAVDAARAFWARVAACGEVSGDFRGIAVRQDRVTRGR